MAFSRTSDHGHRPFLSTSNDAATEMPKKRSKAQTMRRPAKRQEMGESSEQPTDDTTPSWRQIILSSSALRERWRFPPTGPLSAEQTDQYLSLLWSCFFPALRYSQKTMPDASEYTWPNDGVETPFRNHEGMDAALAQVAVTIANNDAWWDQIPGPEMEEALQTIRELLPKRAASPSMNPSFAQAAFEGEEIPDSTGTYPSYRLKQKLIQYIAKYYDAKGDSGYHSPYASIVGPSGSGKTFSVKQLANREKTWVIYTSLSRVNASVPGQGAIGVYLQGLKDEKAFSQFWDRYIRAGVLLVELAKEEDITPGVLFRLQYHADYFLFREALAKLVGSTGAKPCTRLAVRKIVQETVSFETLREWEAVTPGQHTNRDEASEAGKTPIIFCFDEARGLLQVPADELRTTKANDGQPIAFRQLRHALAHRGQDENKRRALQIFGLLLDTSSRVQNFSPPTVHDPSTKEGQSTDLFPPLYGIHTTWDGFAKRSPEIQKWLTTIVVSDEGSDGSDGSSGSSGSIHSGPQRDDDWYRFLYSLGRPLWGAILETSLQTHSDDDTGLSGGVQAVHSLVRTKLTLHKAATIEERDYHHIALLLFRLQFYLSDHKLSEACVADWLHFVRHVSADRTTIQTMQPGEPILAQYVMHKMKESPDLREEIIKSLAKSLHYGALNVGDSSEICAGLLLLLAADATPEERNNEGVQFMHKSLASFLETFVGWSPTSSPFLAHSRVHVTRLGRLRDKASCITQRHLQVAFLTGEAWFLSTNFPGADVLVPVWQGPGRPMTALLVQIKNKDGPTEITPNIRLQARMVLGTGRKQVEALNMNPGLTVYGLFLNLRPLPPSSDGTRAEELSLDPTDGNLSLFVKMGFDQETFPFLAPGECNVLGGIAGSHIIDMSEEETRNLAPMLDTRDGSTFINYN